MILRERRLTLWMIAASFLVPLTLSQDASAQSKKVSVTDKMAAADLVSAAPNGKIVIAQGTDPSTLDMTNHQETPAANVGAQIFETLVERDENQIGRAHV